MTIPCKLNLHLKRIQALRPEGLLLFLLGFLNYEGLPNGRSFFLCLITWTVLAWQRLYRPAVTLALCAAANWRVTLRQGGRHAFWLSQVSCQCDAKFNYPAQAA